MFTLCNFAAMGLAATIFITDPFQDPNELTCGRVRPLAEQVAMFLNDPLAIHDGVVMDYWESRDDDVLWTPLCTARHDTVQR